MALAAITDIALRHFKAYSATISAGGVCAAGVQLRRSPSSVSRSVALIEKALGVALLDRASNGVTPTQTGDLVAARCVAIRSELARLHADMMRDYRLTLRGNSALIDMQTDLSHLRAVIAVHDLRSVQRAADFLGLSQPAISYSVRLLESDLGVALFTRLRTGTSPSPAGLKVVVTARRILSELSKLVDDVSSVGGVSSGVVRVGGLPYSRAVVLPDAIKMVLSRNPAISVRTIEGPIGALLAALQGDELDALLCAYPDRSHLEGLTVEPIALDPVGFFVSRDHPLAERIAIPLRDLVAFPFVLPPKGTITRTLLTQFFTASGHPAPKGRAETSSSSVIRNLIVESDFVGFRSVREFLVQTPDDRIVLLDIEVPLPTRTICILRRDGVRPTAAITDFLNAVRASGESSVES